MSELTRLYPTIQNEFCIPYKHVCIFAIGRTMESNIYLEESYYLLTKTLKCSGNVLKLGSPLKCDWNILRCANYCL